MRFPFLLLKAADIMVDAKGECCGDVQVWNKDEAFKNFAVMRFFHTCRTQMSGSFTIADMMQV